MDSYRFPTAIVADNDGIYGSWLDVDLKELLAIEVHHIPTKEPWKNGRCERFHLNAKVEVLSRIDIADAEHVQTLCMANRSRYNAIRPHQALGGQIPTQKLAVGKPQQASGPI